MLGPQQAAAAGLRGEPTRSAGRLPVIMRAALDEEHERELDSTAS